MLHGEDKLINPDPEIELKDLGYTEKMGPILRREIERQLLADLQNYGVNINGLQMDWSDTCPEGHVTEALNGTLENWSGVAVLTTNGVVVAEGWLDFIHGGGTNPLFVFWEYLTIYEDNKEQRVKTSPASHNTYGISSLLVAKIYARGHMNMIRHGVMTRL